MQPNLLWRENWILLKMILELGFIVAIQFIENKYKECKNVLNLKSLFQIKFIRDMTSHIRSILTSVWFLTFRLSSLSCLTSEASSSTTDVLRFSAISSCCPAWSPSSFSKFLYAFVHVNLQENNIDYINWSLSNFLIGLISFYFICN